MSKVYDNGVIREKPYWALEGFSKSIALVDEFGEIISNPEYDSLNFRTGEEAREYASEHGLKENEYCIGECKVQHIMRKQVLI